VDTFIVVRIKVDNGAYSGEMVAVNLNPELGGQSHEREMAVLRLVESRLLETQRADRHLLYLIHGIPLDLRSIG
jgi:hypothetical protein